MQIGDRGFYDGRIFKIVGSMEGNWVLYNDELSYSALVVPKHRVERVAEDVYAVGDIVASFHVFEGTVTGFEQQTNRVICRSLRGQDRVRYAYKLEELTERKVQHIFG